MLLLFCYLTLGVLIAAVEVQRMRARQSFNALSLFNGAYFLFFVFAPLNVLVFGEAAVRQKHVYQTWSVGDAWTALSLSLTYIVFVLGYHQHRRKTAVSGQVQIGVQGTAIVSTIAGVFFLVGALALWYHIDLVGGALEALYLSPQIRTGEFKLNGNFLFVRQFGAFLATAFTLYWAAHLDAALPRHRSRPVRFFRYVALVLFGMVFVYYALSTYGRREFVYPMLACLLAWALAGRRGLWEELNIWVVLSVVWACIYFVVIPSAQPAQSADSQHSHFMQDAYFATIQGLADSFMHYVAAQHARLWQFGFLADLSDLPLQFVPSQILGFDRGRGMFGETSEFVLGHPLKLGLAGVEPLGLHGYLLVNFAYPGMFLLFYLGGKGYSRLDTALRPKKGGGAVSWVIFIWAVIGAIEFLREGAFILVLKPHFSWWLAIGLLTWFEHSRRSKSALSSTIHITKHI